MDWEFRNKVLIEIKSRVVISNQMVQNTFRFVHKINDLTQARFSLFLPVSVSVVNFVTEQLLRQE